MVRNRGLIVAVLLSAMTLNAEDGGAPALVELFTSQGCSSCPAAEETLSGWGREAFERGEIVPLAFHVDYWDSLGWPDPFAAAAFTRRQRRYGRAFGAGSVYTPQMVVDGRAEFVGSDGARAAREAGRARGRTARVGVTRGLSDDLRVTARPLAGFPPGGARVHLAVLENGLVTAVKRGENAGRSLRNDFVVREFRELGEVSPTGTFEATVAVPSDPAWKARNCGAAVFVQDDRTMEILGAGSLYPLD